MNIVKEMTKTCERKDCRIYLDSTGFTNAAGRTSMGRCFICKRRWSIHVPSRWSYNDRPVFDRDGNDVSDPPPPPQIREVTDDD